MVGRAPEGDRRTSRPLAEWGVPGFPESVGPNALEHALPTHSHGRGRLQGDVPCKGACAVHPVTAAPCQARHPGSTVTEACSHSLPSGLSRAGTIPWSEEVRARRVSYVLEATHLRVWSSPCRSPGSSPLGPLAWPYGRRCSGRCRNTPQSRFPRHCGGEALDPRLPRPTGPPALPMPQAAAHLSAAHPPPTLRPTRSPDRVS